VPDTPPLVVAQCPEVISYDDPTSPRARSYSNGPIPGRLVSQVSSPTTNLSPRDATRDGSILQLLGETSDSVFTTRRVEVSTNTIIPAIERNLLLKYYVDHVAPRVSVFKEHICRFGILLTWHIAGYMYTSCFFRHPHLQAFYQFHTSPLRYPCTVGPTAISMFAPKQCPLSRQ